MIVDYIKHKAFFTLYISLTISYGYFTKLILGSRQFDKISKINSHYFGLGVMNLILNVNLNGCARPRIFNLEKTVTSFNILVSHTLFYLDKAQNKLIDRVCQQLLT